MIPNVKEGCLSLKENKENKSQLICLTLISVCLEHHRSARNHPNSMCFFVKVSFITLVHGNFSLELVQLFLALS